MLITSVKKENKVSEEALTIKIDPLDQAAMDRSRAVWTSVCKPLGSLGLLEDLVVRLAGIFGTEDVRITKRCAVIVCADNGVIEEGVTQADAGVTAAVAAEIAEGKSNINIMADAAGIDTVAVDVGMRDEVSHPGVLQYKIANGTKNMTKGPAMTREQTITAIQTGILLAGQMKEQGYQILLTGEMGIGNTTTSSAIASVLLGLPVEEVTGRGAGLSSDGLQRKIAAIHRAIEVNAPDKEDPLDVLSKLGGFDIAAMVGLFLGGGIYRIPVVIDGLISSIAALLATQIHTGCVDYMLASHMTEEPAGRMVLERLGLPAIVHAGMRLGEGTGAVCLIPILDIALAEYHNAHRFGASGIAQYEKLD